MQAMDLNPFMESAVAEVLEAMCFISSEGPTENDIEELGADWICGELDFIGDASGTFGIAVPPATAAIIAANFLGEDEADLTSKESGEVICELTNMVCGTLLAQVDSKNVFTLSKPRLIPHSIPVSNFERIERTYVIDEGYIRAWIELKVAA